MTDTPLLTLAEIARMEHTASVSIVMSWAKGDWDSLLATARAYWTEREETARLRDRCETLRVVVKALRDYRIRDYRIR